MTDFVRRFVSGAKARFKDHDLNLELDLVYVTDQIIVMGYPAAGVEGLYRNRREDVQRFLEHRHGKNFWVYNFCPVKENAYPPSVFEGRVSRYPFPDHHAPPLALLPLAARDMHTWLSGSSDRVAVLHCKAGKGRSGTLACSYLLTLKQPPSAPQLRRSYSTKQWAKQHAEELMQVMPSDDDADAETDPRKGLMSPDGSLPNSRAASQTSLQLTRKSDGHSSNNEATTSPVSANGPMIKSTLDDVLNLHTSRRMKAPSSPNKKVKRGVSIPSQQRWLYYWSLILSHNAPASLWPMVPTPIEKRPKVQLTQIKLRLRETSQMKMQVIKAANTLLERTGIAKKGHGATENAQVWASIARYDDQLVETLEKWERNTRDESGDMGRRKRGSEHTDQEHLSDVFKDDRWDSKKMVRGFAKMAVRAGDKTTKEDVDKEIILTYTLKPLTSTGHSDHEVVEGAASLKPTDQANGLSSNYLEEGIVLDAHREVRVKLYLGQLFMGWLWMVPIFHMDSQDSTKVLLTRKEIDFPLGVGAGIIDVELSMRRVPESLEVSPPLPGQPDGEAENDEPAGISATLGAIREGEIHDAIHSKQAAED